MKCALSRNLSGATKHHSRVVTISVLYSGEPKFKSRPGGRMYIPQYTQLALRLCMNSTCVWSHSDIAIEVLGLTGI
jgi:hypothetical protein